MLFRKKGNVNETEVQKVQRGFKAGFFAGIIASAVILTFKMIYKQPWTDSFVGIAAVYVGQNFYEWYRDRTKKDKLLYAAIYLFFTILMIVTYYVDISK